MKSRNVEYGHTTTMDNGVVVLFPEMYKEKHGVDIKRDQTIKGISPLGSEMVKNVDNFSSAMT